MAGDAIGPPFDSCWSTCSACPTPADCYHPGSKWETAIEPPFDSDEGDDDLTPEESDWLLNFLTDCEADDA